MIGNGSSDRCVWWWTEHLESEDNEQVRIVQSYGLRSETIEGMLDEMMAFAVGTPCKNPFYQLNLSPAPGECLTDKQWDRVREIVEEEHGLKGQPSFMVMHTKDGEQHVHFIHGRINLETGKTISDSHDARKNHAVARKIEREFGLQKVIGPYDLEPGMPRPKRAPRRWESLRAYKTGINIDDLTAEITELRRQSENGQEFQAALKLHGYPLVIGRRGLLILDSAGKEHSLVRRIEGINTAELNAFMRGVDREALPTLEQGRAQYQERKIAGLEADRATVRDEIQWEEALAKAAIAKEEREKHFLSPEDREIETRGAEAVRESAQRETTQRDNEKRDELRALQEERAELQKQIEAQRRIEQLDRLIFAALLEQAIRHPERLDEAQLLAWKMPTAFTIELNEIISAVQHAHGIEVSDIDRLISEREMHAGKVLLAEMDLATPALGPLAFAALQRQQQEHEGEIALRDPVIFAGLLEHAIRQPQRLGQSDSWKMPDEFTEQLTDTINAIREAQALNLDLSGIDKLITEREAQARALERDEWKREREEFIAEGQKRQAERQAEQERQAAPPKPKPRAPELGRIDAGIRLAYSLTRTGQEFANAIEDRGLITARVTESDAKRLNKWERQRLKELKELEDALLLRERFGDLAKAVTGTAEQQQQPKAVGKKNPPKSSRADTWMAQTGGVDNLTPELLDQAQASYDKWTGPKEKYGLADYVTYVQTREAERRNQEPEQGPPGKYKVGEIVIVDEWGGVYQLNFRNTGDTLREREDHLRNIAPLMSVTAAQGVMKEFQQHRQQERQHEWQQKREEWLQPAREEYWPINPPQPERKSPELFGKAATEAGRDDRMENLTGPAAQVWRAWQQSDSAQAYAAALDDKGVSFARATQEEAYRSHRDAEFARAAGNYAPPFKEGEIVIVTEARPEYRRDGELTERRRVYKLDQSLAEKFVKRLDNRDKLQGIDATVKASDERAKQRATDREALRLEKATDIIRGGRTRAGNIKDNLAKSPAAILKPVAMGLNVIGKPLQILENVFEGLFAPKLTPEQIRDGEIAARERQADVRDEIDHSNAIARRAQERQQEEEREAARQREERERYGGGRER